MKFLRSILFFAGTVLIYLLIPLLGWGLGYLAEFFAFPPRLGYSIIVGLFGLAVGIQAYTSILGIRGGKGEQEKFVFRQHVVRILLIFALYITLFFIPLFDRLGIGVFSAPAGFNWLGVIFSAIGYSLIFLSGLALGRQYSPDVTIQKDHQLITAGIFRSIRNPRYLGIIALSIGVSLIFRSWIGLIATLIFMGVLIYRIRDEEATLRLEFGAQWDSYCHHSWRLLPYIY
ncbi:MAG TPA: isoprenylcysteine carboxylmethyltransferase family protein [Anaerolineales bacterium]